MFQLICPQCYLSVLPIHSTLSSPLLDRCEIVHLVGYTFDEKVAIANRFSVPKQIGMNGLKAICRDERGNTERDRYRVGKRGWGEEFGEGLLQVLRGSKLYSGPNGWRSLRAMGKLDMFLRRKNWNHRQHRHQWCYTIQLSTPPI